MSFTARMRDTYADLFEAFRTHPFLVSLRRGDTAREAAVAYVGQDAAYLRGFERCYGLGLALSPDPDWQAFFIDGAGLMLREEPAAHRALVAPFGVDYDAVQAEHLAPAGQAYVDHMLVAGHDTLGVLMAALLPCQWTYTWAATGALDAGEIGPGHPFAAWFAFYASAECVRLVADYRARTDTLAEAAGPAEVTRMERAFAVSMHHEIAFWEAALTGQTWHSLPARVLAGR